MTMHTTHIAVGSSTQRKGRNRAGTSRRSFGAGIEMGGAGAANTRRAVRCSSDGLSLSLSLSLFFLRETTGLVPFILLEAKKAEYTERSQKTDNTNG